MRPFTIRPSKCASPSSRAVAILLLLISSVLFIDSRVALASGSLEDRLAGDPKVPWQISADTVDYDAATTTYYARGNVVIEKQKTRLVADQVAFNRLAMTASATGHVVMTVGGDLLTGDRLDIDLNRETGVLNDGSIFFKASHFYIRGQHIEKTGKETYIAERASVTTCDGDRPAWTITGRKVNITVEGYGTAQHAVFKAREVPMLYTPYILFPVKTKRQTGLLMPELGYSDRKGFYWEQPFFWAISESSDATVYINPMQERGTRVGMEYRYALNDLSYGTIMADGFEDRRIDDGTDEASQWAYDDDKYNRPNKDRYWLRAKLDQELPAGIRAWLDLDLVSDQDYLEDFKDGPSGYKATRDYFLDTFDRDIDTGDDNIRTNQLNINKTWQRYVLNADLIWNDNVVKRRWAAEDDTLQQLPSVLFNGLKQSLFDSDFYWDIDSEYTYFYREDGDRGQRMDIHPRVYLPLAWKNYLSIEPSAGWRQTSWVMDRWEDESLNRTRHRKIYDLELDLSTEISKVMASPLAIADRIRHSIKPQITYTYIPNQDQSDLPYFTSVDRIETANRVTYALTNTFTARLNRPAPPAPSDQHSPDQRSAGDNGRLHSPDPRSDDSNETLLPTVLATSLPESTMPSSYYRFCRVYLEQSYDIAAARAHEREVFSEIYGELDLNVGPYLGFDSDASFDTYQNRLSSHNVSATVSDPRGDRIKISHRYRTHVNESLSWEVLAPLTDSFFIWGEYERDLFEGQAISQGMGVLYKAQCWGMSLYYEEEGDNRSYAVRFNFKGLGEIGR